MMTVIVGEPMKTNPTMLSRLAAICGGDDSIVNWWQHTVLSLDIVYLAYLNAYLWKKLHVILENNTG